MEKMTQITFVTSPDGEAKAAGESIERTVTLDWSDCSLEEVLVFAAETVKIRQLQTRIRKDPNSVGDTFKVVRPGVRATQAPMTAAKILAGVSKYTPEEKAELIAKLMALQ